MTTAGEKKWPALVARRVAADDDLGAGGDRRLDLVGDLLALGRRDHRADVGARRRIGSPTTSERVWSTNACR